MSDVDADIEPAAAVRLDAVSVRFGTTTVLHEISATFETGRSYAVTGPSGSGKSTLLSVVAGLLRPTAGRVELHGAPITGAGAVDPRPLVSWISQIPTLLPNRSALDNVTVACELGGMSSGAAAEVAEAKLVAVGLGHRLATRATDLSGGEQQRVVVARSLALGRPLVLADEPTASLDRANADLVGRAILDARSGDTTVIVATHDAAVAALCDVTVSLAASVLVAV